MLRSQTVLPPGLEADELHIWGNLRVFSPSTGRSVELKSPSEGQTGHPIRSRIPEGDQTSELLEYVLLTPFSLLRGVAWQGLALPIYNGVALFNGLGGNKFNLNFSRNLI